VKRDQENDAEDEHDGGDKELAIGEDGPGFGRRHGILS
jgi:hypothetical protein